MPSRSKKRRERLVDQLMQDGVVPSTKTTASVDNKAAIEDIVGGHEIKTSSTAAGAASTNHANSKVVMKHCDDEKNDKDEDDDDYDEDDDDEDEHDEEDEDNEYNSKEKIRKLINISRSNMPDIPSQSLLSEKNLQFRSAIASTPHPTVLMSKENYIKRQNQIFQELTGFASWRSKRETQVDNDSNYGSLMRMLEVFAAGQDELIYNEFSEQKYLMDIVDDAADDAVRHVMSMTSNNLKLKSLIINYGRLRGQLGNLQSEFLEMSAARNTVERQREHLQTKLTDEFTKRIKLEHICKGMSETINQLKKRVDTQHDQEKELSNLKNKLASLEQSQEDILTVRKELSDLKAELNKVSEIERDLKSAIAMRDSLIKANSLSQSSSQSPEKTILKSDASPSRKSSSSPPSTPHSASSKTPKPASSLPQPASLTSSLTEADISSSSSSQPQLSTSPFDASSLSISSISPSSGPVPDFNKQSSGIKELFEIILTSAPSLGLTKLDVVGDQGIERPERIKQLIRLFFDQYAAREKYYKCLIRDKDLQLQMYLSRAKQERALAETERKRALVLRDQITASVEAYSTVKSLLDGYMQRFNGMGNLVEVCFDILNKSTEKLASLEREIKEERFPALQTVTEKLDLLSDMVQNQHDEHSSTRDTLQKKVNALDKLCRTWYEERGRLQKELAIQTALVKEMRGQAGDGTHDDNDERDTHAIQGKDKEDEDDDYDKEDHHHGDEEVDTDDDAEDGDHEEEDEHEDEGKKKDHHEDYNSHNGNGNGHSYHPDNNNSKESNDEDDEYDDHDPDLDLNPFQAIMNIRQHTGHDENDEANRHVIQVMDRLKTYHLRVMDSYGRPASKSDIELFKEYVGGLAPEFCSSILNYVDILHGGCERECVMHSLLSAGRDIFNQVLAHLGAPTINPVQFFSEQATEAVKAWTMETNAIANTQPKASSSTLTSAPKPASVPARAPVPASIIESIPTTYHNGMYVSRIKMSDLEGYTEAFAAEESQKKPVFGPERPPSMQKPNGSKKK